MRRHNQRSLLIISLILIFSGSAGHAEKKETFFGQKQSGALLKEFALDLFGPDEDLFPWQKVPPKDKVIAFYNVNVLTMESKKKLRKQTVIVKKGKIKKIGNFKKVRIPRRARIVDGKGGFLMPGLTDMHVHPHYYLDGLLHIANGITYIRVMNGSQSMLDFRTAIREGEVIGPDFTCAGPITDGYPPVFSSNRSTVHNPDEGRQFVREYYNAGYDYMKIYSNLTRADFDAIMDEARKYNFPVVGHVPTQVTLYPALDARMSSMEHQYFIAHEMEDPSSPYYEATMETIGARKLIAAIPLNNGLRQTVAQRIKNSGVWICHTLTIFDRWLPPEQGHLIMKRPEMKYVPPSLKDHWNPDTNYLITGYLTGMTSDDFALGRRNRRLIFKTLVDSGSNTMMGSDAGALYCVPGFSSITEVENYVEAGMSPFKVLQLSTVEPGRYLGRTGKMGVIVRGARADLILLKKNPFKKIRNLHSRIGVMAAGRWYSEENLQQLLEETATYVESLEESPNNMSTTFRIYSN